MSENALLAELQKAMYGNEPWHGPSFRDLIRDLTPAQAHAHPIEGAHSIWEIVLHADAWQRIVRRRLEGETFDVTTAMDWPKAPKPDAAAWKKTLAALAESERALEESLLAQPAGRFDHGGKAYDARLTRNAHGQVAHLAYHGGQIAMLRRAQGLEPMAG